MFTFDPYSPQVDADPFPYYKTLRDEHPCFWSPEARMWVLSRHADIKVALQDWQTYSSARGNLMDELPDRAGATLGTTDPPRHDRMRALISHAFTKRNLEAAGEPVRAVVRGVLEEIRGRREFDFVGDFSSKVTAKILFRILGLPEGDDQEVRERAVLMVQSDPVTRQKGADHVAAYRWMMDYAGGVIAERRRNPGEDLLSQFCLAEIDGERLTEREVLLTTTTLIMAGVESLGGFTVMFGLNMADFAAARREIVADPALLPDAIEESLRYNTSGQRFRRSLMRDVSLHGQTMKAGDFVCLAYGAANRDERQFPDPDRYDIRRKPRTHLGFGGGVHACLGSVVARMAVRITFEEFLSAFPNFSRVHQDLPWMPSTTFRSPMRLDLAVH
ncbi:MAG: cytochrome P450 [Gammaproteobacteria bacterium]|nr:cytochrome P450 [Gammaproteobacteria bacterium]